MARVCLSLLGVVVVATVAVAQSEKQPVEPPDGVPVIKLAVRPIPRLPRALKYQLLPDPRELTTDNAAPHWLRVSQMMSQHRPELTDKQYRWATSETLLNDLPRREVRQFLDKFRTAFQVAEVAARCNRCDWDFPRLGAHDTMDVLLPEVQCFREFANVLSIQIRLELAEGNFDQALHTLQTGFALAKHVGEAPTAIHALVGIALTAVMTSRLEELIQLPEAPNLYWALTMLPRPFLDERKPLYGEMNLWYRTFPFLRDVPTTPMKPEQAQELIEAALREAGRLMNSPKPTLQERLFVTGQVAVLYPEAKRALIAQGLAPEQVEAMPSVQAVALHLQRKIQTQLDEWMKWIYVPYWQAAAGLEKAEKGLRPGSSNSPRGISVEETLLRLGIPALAKMHTALLRMDRQLAGLRCAEAIRLHAATHDGQLPETLAAITEVPLPVDPITGKSFDTWYTYKDGQAVLEVPPPPWATQPLLGRRYVFTGTR
jgi:hypothetical protein